MRLFISLVLKQRWLVSVALIASLALSFYSARSIRIRFQFRDFYDYPENPRLELFKQDLREFGDPGGNIVVMVEANDVFERGVLGYVQHLTTALEERSEFARIRSLTNVQAIRDRGGDVVTGTLLSPIPENPAALRALRVFALQSRLLRRRLVSVDGKLTAILAETRKPSAFSNIAEQREAIEVVAEALRRNPPPNGVTVHVTGAPVVNVAVTDSLTRDQMVLTPALLAVLSLVLFVTFRSVHGILLCLSAVGLATIWTAGLFAQTHRPVDLIGSVIPTTILVYGVVDPIFILTRVLNKLEGGLRKHDAIVEAFSELALPCFLTSLTTALGFASFVTARQPTIRYYGLTVAAGVLLAWVTTITVLPTLIALVPIPKKRFGSFASTRWIDTKLQSLWGLLRSRIPQTIAVTCVALALGAGFGRKQHVNNVYVDELPSGEARHDVRLLEQKLTGVLALVVHLEGAPDDMKRPEILQSLERIDQAMSQEPLVTFATSLADLVGEANQAFHDGDPAARIVPTSRALVAQYLALVDPKNRSLFVTEDYARSHVLVLLADEGSKKTRAVATKLGRLVELAGLESLGVKATVTGSATVGYAEFDDVVRQLLSGFITAFAIIVLLQWVVFRSLRIALISIVPNVLPVIACFIVLRVLRIDLKIDTALVLCISVGGLFNTTIHFAARTQQLVAAGERDPDVVIGRAMRAVGPPALFTSLALSAGFAVLLLSSFPGLQALGLLSMVTLTIGFFSDMIVTAVLLRVGFAWPARIPLGGQPVHGGDRSLSAKE